MTTDTEVALRSPVQALKDFFSSMNASQVAELFLSPFVEPDLLNQATAEEGPSLWIVNRSDVYDETLTALSAHPVPAISARAREKLGLRQSKLVFLSPPELPDNLEDTPEYLIEDLLGHPLVPLQIPLYFSHHVLEDFRSSAALSFTRRLLEHPPNWNYDLALKLKILDNFFRLLLTDPSPMVRSYIARIPMFESSHITEALGSEKNDFVRARLLQNPAACRQTLDMLNDDLLNSLTSHSLSAPNATQELPPESLFLMRVAAADKRSAPELRRPLVEKLLNRSADRITLALHGWYLSKSG